MNEAQVKAGLLRYLDEFFHNSEEFLAVEEVPLNQGRTRAGLVVIGPRLLGFEIKSPLDDLSRLPRQLEDYRPVFDEVTLVIGLKHLTGVLGQIPGWCGILLVSPLAGEASVELFREAQPNLQRDRYRLAQLLWRDEALKVCEKHGFDYGVRSKPRLAIWERLAERLPVEQLAFEVREALRLRGATWRVDPRFEERLPKPKRRRRRRRRRTRR
ncbi:MAG: sce7726 family protein [Candidatus Eremiobacteraeota bacterium]|nr:sce7726 family protein [Candidatus Eremiobacteraeota bacterium]